MIWSNLKRWYLKRNFNQVGVKDMLRPVISGHIRGHEVGKNLECSGNGLNWDHGCRIAL